MPLHLDQSHPRAPPGFRGYPRHDPHDSRVGRVEAKVEDVHHDSQHRDPPLMILLLLSMDDFLILVYFSCLYAMYLFV